MSDKNYNEGYQNDGYQDKYPSAPAATQLHFNESDYPAPSYAQATTPIISASQQPSYQTIPIPITQVIIVGGCPACRVGVLEDDYTCCGIMCAVLFFPLGVLCCLLTKQRRCSNCGASFG